MPGLGDRLTGGPAPPGPGLGDRLRGWWNNTTFFKPVWDELTGAATLPGDVYSGAQPTMMMDPQTGEFHTAPELMDRAGALAGSMTLGAGAIPAEANALRMGIKAYHGSPHDFERFDASKIGTGEGAQAYGHGLYFAEREGVARDYRDKLSAKWSPDLDKDPAVLARYLMDGNTKEGALLGLQLRKDQWKGRPSAYPDNYGSVLDDAIRFVETDSIPPAGRMYEVSIDADPEQFLDWDKPLSEQSPQVREVFGGIGGDLRMSELADLRAPTTAKQLSEAGIPGIRYLDQGSRGAAAATPQRIAKMREEIADLKNKIDNPPEWSKDQPGSVEGWKMRLRDTEAALGKAMREEDVSRNYVVFDERLISILKKYGLPISAAGLAALSQLHPEEAQAAQAGLGERLQQAH